MLVKYRLLIRNNFVKANMILYLMSVCYVKVIKPLCQQILCQNSQGLKSLRLRTIFVWQLWFYKDLSEWTDFSVNARKACLVSISAYNKYLSPADVCSGRGVIFVTNVAYWVWRDQLSRQVMIGIHFYLMRHAYCHFRTFDCFNWRW